MFSPHRVGKNERGEAKKKRVSNSLQLLNFKVLAHYTFMIGNKGFGSLQSLVVTKDLGLSNSLVVTKDLGLYNLLVVTKDLGLLW